ncbi:MAG: Uma2 family endonuclease [Gemmataceae bacterium]|nr:Uma2 family endonuclease [Gemmataceae bacterium]
MTTVTIKGVEYRIPDHLDLPPSEGAITEPGFFKEWPGHLDLPSEDPSMAVNFQEPPQTTMLTDTLHPRLVEVYGEDNFAVGANNFLYWRLTEPVLDGCKAPDWFLVPGVRATLDGAARRSYVLWRELQIPLLIAEYVSGAGTEERDATPNRGKFWVYERAVRAPYYVIHDGFRGTLEVWHLADTPEGQRYRPVAPNAHGRYPIPELRIELGLWHGRFQGAETAWLRAWDAGTGRLLPTSEERAEAERQRADLAERTLESAQAGLDAEREKVRLLRERLRAAGIDPDA